MQPREASFLKIIWTDYAACLSWIFMLVMGGLLAYDQLTGQLELGNILIYMTVAVVLIGIGVILWRVRLISSAFEFGWEVEADITDIGFFRDRGRVTYVFTIQGQRYQVGNAIMKNKYTWALQRGQKVTVIARQGDPKIAFIRDLYS